jgi:methylenetetrahydrofolate--tRNA-(uracil-5-)-methyltransferase
VRATVVGAGLAGCEAAWQLAQAGVMVELIDMKPAKKTPAHALDTPAELVCSNSLRSDRIESAVGMLKEEMRRLGSLILAAADQNRVPAGEALAVDREGFSRTVGAMLRSHAHIHMVCREMDAIPDGPCVVATGPLTSAPMAGAIAALIGTDLLYFHDAVAPIVTAESIDMSRAFRGSRYGRGEDYINCPMTHEEYDAFYRALIDAQQAPLHDFETMRVFEGCMPIEEIARRGYRTMAFGPLRPTGFRDKLGKRPFAVVQLRQDDSAATLYNIVGFQTRLKFGEQKRVFSMIPGLERAEFVRYGVMHRNTYIDSPRCLTGNYRFRGREDLYYAGQITGVEGYVESAASGLLAGLSLARRLSGLPEPDFGRETMIGAMAAYVTDPGLARLDPMNANLGLLTPLPEEIRGKRERGRAMAARALTAVESWIRSNRRE